MYNLTNYKRLLEHIGRYYKISFFNTNVTHSKGKPVAIMRHDIDYSLSEALKMARLESSLGLKTTYMVMVSSPFYNIFEKKNKESILEIARLGHKIGLHFYVEQDWVGKCRVITKKISEDFDILKKCLSSAEPLVSWHNPTAGLIGKERLYFNSFIINAYDTKFIKEYFYISDSNYRHTFSQLIQLLKDNSGLPLHLLIHPFIWTLNKEAIEEALTAIFIKLCQEKGEGFVMNKIWNKNFPAGLPKDFYKKIELELERLFKRKK